jgi:hypothetical protein
MSFNDPHDTDKNGRSLPAVTSATAPTRLCIAYVVAGSKSSIVEFSQATRLPPQLLISFIVSGL